MTMMKNFEDATATPVAQVEVSTALPALSSSVTVRTVAHVGKPDDQWTWQDIRDYVINSIESLHGPFPRDLFREIGTFKSFSQRWGVEAPAIARCAFEVHNGMWYGEKVSITRFCKGSDPFFSRPISEALRASRV